MYMCVSLHYNYLVKDLYCNAILQIILIITGKKFMLRMALKPSLGRNSYAICVFLLFPDAVRRKFTITYKSVKKGIELWLFYRFSTEKLNTRELNTFCSTNFENIFLRNIPKRYHLFIMEVFLNSARNSIS